MSDLRNGFATGKVFFTDNDTYVGFTAVAAALVEPNLPWVVAGDPGATKNVAINVATATNLLLVRRSDSTTYFCAVDDGTSNTGIWKGTALYASVDTVAHCITGTKQ
jgi:hypothetical protein